MWLFRFKRFMAEREVFVSLIVFGICAMFADVLSDMGRSLWSAFIRGLGLAFLLFLLVWELWLRPRFRQPFPMPLMFTEETDRSQARSQFERFVQDANLTGAVKVLRDVSSLQREDLLIRLDQANLRNSREGKDWEIAWDKLLREWEREVDKKLVGEPFTSEGKCYHIFPHVVLPLAFALGASADLRRSVVLYHYEQERFYQVMDLTRPRSLFHLPDSSIPSPESIPQDLSTLPKAEKLILHLAITDRHDVQIDRHPHHNQATNAALIYRQALNPGSDWLPYAQWLVQKANPLMTQYRRVDVCLICPSAIAFALGMAFSRTPHITMCHWLGNQYVPVFSLEVIERRLPFD